MLMLALAATVLSAPPHAAGKSERPAPLDWRSLEAPLLTGHVQITSRDRFLKAGEAYFDHQSPPQWVIFQAVPVPAEGQAPDPFYTMYVAKLTRDDGGKITGTEEPVRISPEGSANTCGWFHPTNPGVVLYGSTMSRPSDQQKSGFQVGTRKYVWMFPEEMEIVEQGAFAVGGGAGGGEVFRGPVKQGTTPTVLFSRPAYDAECSYSRDGRFVLYARIRETAEPLERPDADLFVFDTEEQKHHALVTADGYDGGPFFSPDGRWICYRSDRRGDDLLQLFIAELEYENGVPVGIKRELQVTDNSDVNWAPFWHPSGRYLVYGTSEVGHHNYEVFAVEVNAEKPAKGLMRRRVTHADGADVLPVFSDDGKLMMWTAQRGPLAKGESRPSSQVWIAETTPDTAPERVFQAIDKAE